MFIRNFTLKIIFFCLSLIFLSNCANYSKSVPTSTNISESKGSVIRVTPPPFLGQKAKVKGENQAIKITDDLKTSVEQQQLPKIWLEFDQESGEVLKTELDSKLKEQLSSDGKSLFQYQYVINNSENPDERYDVSYKNSMTFINTLNEIKKMEIDSPDGKRRLTEEETTEILFKQAGLINDRYYELDDHFKPKSAFYRFKKSINEKIGYSIF